MYHFQASTKKKNEQHWLVLLQVNYILKYKTQSRSICMQQTFVPANDQNRLELERQLFYHPPTSQPWPHRIQRNSQQRILVKMDTTPSPAPAKLPCCPQQTGDASRTNASSR